MSERVGVRQRQKRLKKDVDRVFSGVVEGSIEDLLTELDGDLHGYDLDEIEATAAGGPCSSHSDILCDS